MAATEPVVTTSTVPAELDLEAGPRTLAPLPVDVVPEPLPTVAVRDDVPDLASLGAAAPHQPEPAAPTTTAMPEQAGWPPVPDHPEEGQRSRRPLLIGAAVLACVVVLAAGFIVRGGGGPTSSSGSSSGTVARNQPTVTADPPSATVGTADSPPPAPTTTTVATTPAPSGAATPAPTIAATVPPTVPATVAATAPATAPPTPAPAPPTTVFGDLALPIPMQRPACDGQFVVLVAAAVTPGKYVEQVADVLAEFPEARYLRTDQTCTSFRQNLDGNPIYSVYYGPFPDIPAACNVRNVIGGDAYVKVLDNVSPIDRQINC